MCVSACVCVSKVTGAYKTKDKVIILTAGGERLVLDNREACWSIRTAQSMNLRRTSTTPRPKKTGMIMITVVGSCAMAVLTLGLAVGYFHRRGGDARAYA